MDRYRALYGWCSLPTVSGGLAPHTLTSVYAEYGYNMVSAAVANVEHIIPFTLISVPCKSVVVRDVTLVGHTQGALQVHSEFSNA